MTPPDAKAPSGGGAAADLRERGPELPLDFNEVDVGHTFEMQIAPVTTEQLVRYAGAANDYARIHYDLPYAIEAGVGGIIAHGMLTMAFMGRAVTDGFGPRARVLHISGRFNAPVRLGESVRVRLSITDKRGTQRDAQIDCSLVADVQGRQVASGEATVTLMPVTS
ncbi:MAG: MaoC/PaaZ C-terminal domain-containing protein [Burkholderiaceae bacterium]|nr:MaoC/PaaZ C-terminal domain-containing protein [Burkholderiaceae bacterium]MDO9089555.1 MaoC/PaaZ C-terminal domain-containing protein [Burkholderiaceae bacterium]